MTAIVVKLTLVAVIWGGTLVAGRVAAPEMSAPTAALWRHVVAAVVLVVMLLVREGHVRSSTPGGGSASC